MGCSISQASVSAMYDLVIGKNVTEALGTGEQFVRLMQSKGDAAVAEELEDELEDAVAFAGVSKYPARVKCALMSWMALKDASARASRPRRRRTDMSETTPDAGIYGGKSALLEDVEEAMRDVVDPELGVNVVDLGLVYGAGRRHRGQRRDHRHDADLGGVPADRRHRGPGP